VAKLADGDGSRAAVLGFGVPESLASPVAAVLPWVELATAALLIPSATATLGSALALLLMVSFSAAIARSIARDEAPECHCFGALHSEPAGPRTLVRNLLLAAAALVALLVGPGTGATHWVTTLSGGWLAAVLLGIALIAALIGGYAFGMRLLRRNGELLLRIDALEGALESRGMAVPTPSPTPVAGLPVGTPAPAFELANLDGGRVSLASLLRGASQDLLLVFTDPGCGPCSALLPTLAAWQRERPGELRTVLVSRGAADANRAHAREHGLTDVLLQRDHEVSESFGSNATPGAVIVARDGTVASTVHAGEEQIKALVASRSKVELVVHRAAPAAGRPAPDLTLRTVAGEGARLSSVLAPDGPTMVVFWNPACGFCERMLDQLRAIDASSGEQDGAPALVVISTGEAEANRAMGLEAPILIDDSFAAGTAFGVAGTPSAVLVDGDGRVSSPIAVGADAVLALAGPGGAPVAV
jgi:peroxiredoxin